MVASFPDGSEFGPVSLGRGDRYRRNGAQTRISYPKKQRNTHVIPGYSHTHLTDEFVSFGHQDRVQPAMAAGGFRVARPMHGMSVATALKRIGTVKPSRVPYRCPQVGRASSPACRATLAGQALPFRTPGAANSNAKNSASGRRRSRICSTIRTSAIRTGSVPRRTGTGNTTTA